MIPLLLNDMRTDYYVQSENLDVEIVLEKKIESGLGDDRVTINFANKTVTSVSGDMDGALFHTDIFRCGTDTYVIRLWFSWLSKRRYMERVNLETAELPDLERYDILISKNAQVLLVGTDFHWKEYWYEPDDKTRTIEGVIRKYWHPPVATVSMLYKRFSETDYSLIVKGLWVYCESTYNRTSANGFSGLAIEKRLDDDNSNMEINANSEPTRWKNILRSHVPYVRNGHIVHNIVSKEVDVI